jgi:hypothetical protein
MSESDAKLELVDKTQVKSWPSYGLPAASALIVPPEISFRVDQPPLRDGQVVTLRGLLENTGRAMVAVVVFTHGDGAAGTFGFFVDPAPGRAQRKRRHGPPLPAQAPPPPLVIELPPEIAVRVSNQLVLDEYEWVPGAPMELEWCFWFWNEPRPRGRVIVPP